MKKNTLPLHLEALPREAHPVLKRLKEFLPKGVLGGGTAIALQLGHRQSYDLDCFISTSVPRGLLSRATRTFGAARPIIDTGDELTCIVHDTKLTVIAYPFKPRHPLVRTSFISLFDLRDLASAKAYTIGRRGAWRDYVDLFALLKHGLRLPNIIADAEHRFADSFNAKLFLEQLTYYGDITDRSVEWLGHAHAPRTVERFLAQEVSTYIKTMKMRA